MSEIEGHTFFMRCGDCETMYEAIGDGLSLSSGFRVPPYWVRPRSVRKPKPCAHPLESVEMYADGEWRSMPYEPGRAL